MGSVERAVLDLRAYLGVTGLGSDTANLDRLLEHLVGRLTVCHDAVTTPFLYERENGTATLVLPYHVPKSHYEDIILHECLRVVFSQRYPGIAPLALSRGGSRTAASEAALVRRAVRAWRLPADCLADYTDEELAELSGLDLAEVRQRRQEVKEVLGV